MVIAEGPAGTGKTAIACSVSLEMLMNGRISKIIVTRPTITLGNDIGYLPGDMGNKMEPWIVPIYDNFKEEIDKEYLEKLIKNNIIEIVPLPYIRGRTFSSCWIIADEMQNSSKMEIMTLLTRLGEDSKIIITGDLDQCDLYIDNDTNININTNKIQNGLYDLIARIKKNIPSKYIDIIKFTIDDVERSKFVKHILKLYMN